MPSLDKTVINTLYRVVDISLPEDISKRLSELGLITGTDITRTLTAPCGDPNAYLIRGGQIALRNEYAKKIAVEMVLENNK